MSRPRRRIKSKSCYEICFRAREGLPLLAYETIRLLLGSIVARAQRDEKVVLCHDIWNGSHAHLVIVALDSQQCVRFYGEIQKKITDAIKRLLGLNYLDLWEGGAMVAEIADLDAAMERISYLYANPAQDNLVETIADFPGYSSWREFNEALHRLDTTTEESFPWIRLPSIPPLRSRILSTKEDALLVNTLISNNKQSHILKRHPNAWMRCFGIDTDSAAYQINDNILRNLQDREENARSERQKARRNVMGVSQLQSQPIMKIHKPKKKERKIFVLCSIKELRIKLIDDFKDFCAACRACYLLWRAGDYSTSWPPGAFKPPLPPSMNILPA